MKNFILHKSNLSILIFYFFFAFTSIISIILAEYNNNITPTLFLKQLIFFIFSFGIIYFMQNISVHTYEKISILLFIISIILLVLLLIAPDSIAPVINGAKAWFNFKLFSFQPSEIAKVTTVILVSSLITKEHFRTSSDILKLIQVAIITIIPFILIVKENDTGNALYFVCLFLVLAFLVSNRSKTFLVIYSFVIGFLAIVIGSAIYIPNLLTNIGIKEYQIKRLLSWINPNDYINDYSYQITLALNEVKKAGISGSFEKNVTYIPEQYNDFIFTVIAKNFGFIGATIFIFIYFIFIIRVLRIAKSCQHGNFSYYFLLLASFSIAYSFLMNSYSATGIIPVIGVSMPFISYGGSSLLANSILLGVVLKINKTVYDERMEDYYEENEFDNYE